MPFEAVLDTDREYHDQRLGRQYIFDLLDYAIEIRANAIELVDEDDTRYFGLVGVAPVRLRLWLDATGAAEYADAAIEHLQGAIDFNREVDVSWRVDDVQRCDRPTHSWSPPTGS